MSLARINYSVFAARKGKTLTCEGCRKPIEKGTRYAHFKVGFRSRFVHTYHAGCPIRDSSRESGKMAGIYSGTENAQDAINAAVWMGDPEAFLDEIKSALESAADDWRSVGDEYREAAEASPTGYVFGVDYNEAADSIDSVADELGSWEPDDDEPNIEHEDHADDEDDERTGNQAGDCDECTSATEDWVESTRQSAIDWIDEQQSNIEVG